MATIGAKKAAKARTVTAGAHLPGYRPSRTGTPLRFRDYLLKIAKRPLATFSQFRRRPSMPYERRKAASATRKFFTPQTEEARRQGLK